MPKLVIPQGVLVRLIWNRGGVGHAVNVLGALNPGAVAITQGLTNTVGAAVKAALVSSNLDDSLGSDYSLAQVGLRNIAVEDQAEFLDANAAQPGLEATALLPPQIALVVTLRTALAGPSFRGRVFLGGFTEASNEATSTCTAGSAANAVSFISGVSSALTASGFTLAVLSRPRDAEPLALPPKPAWAGRGTGVTAIVTRNLVWDTQRRRAVPGI